MVGAEATEAVETRRTRVVTVVVLCLITRSFSAGLPCWSCSWSPTGCCDMDLEFEAPFAENPTGASGVTATAVGSPPWVTAEQFEIRDVSLNARSVQPGETITATISYGSDFGKIITRFDIDTDHPDYCTFDRIGFSPGADLYLEVSSGTAQATEGGCWNVSNNDSVTRDVSVAAPVEPGTHTVDIRLVGRSTRQAYDTEQVEIQVDEQAPVVPEPPDNGDGDGDGDGDGGPLEELFDGLLPGGGSPVAPLVVLVVILVALLYLTAI